MLARARIVAYDWGMNQLSPEKQAQIFHCLVEGISLRATARLVGVSFNAVLRTFVKLGKACHQYQSETFRNFKPRYLQLDEQYGFVGAKENNASPENRAEKGWGTIWTWLAIDAESKLVPCWHVGNREARDADMFLSDLAERLACRVQISTDGFTAYAPAIKKFFGDNVDFAQLIKVYRKPAALPYNSPPICVGSYKTPVSGRPDGAHVSTSYAERLNLTVRMKNRRFTRLTNAFSKKVSNHFLSLSMNFFHYNFCRRHMSLEGLTPVMKAGYANHVWTIEEVVALLSKKAVEKAA